MQHKFVPVNRDMKQCSVCGVCMAADPEPPHTDCVPVNPDNLLNWYRTTGAPLCQDDYEYITMSGRYF